MEYVINLILIFFSYSLLGWCIEVTLKYIQFHRFINRGFLTGPICPVYGSGAALITLIVGSLFGEAVSRALVGLQPKTDESARSGLDR